MECIREFLKKYQNKLFKVRNGKSSKNSLELMKLDKNYNKTIEFLSNEYNSGYGFKLLIKKFNLPVSYTKLKFLFDLSGIKRRHGYNVITDKLIEFRRKKAIDEYKNKKGFFKKGVQENLKIRNSSARGIQGYYYNNSIKKYVWLRSSWEYIYAKWLDEKKIKWDIEVKKIDLINGKKYRPDFFIKNDDDDVFKIVEIKGYWRDKVWKFNELKSLLSDIELILITDIKPYLINGIKLEKEISNWKKNRKLNL